MTRTSSEHIAPNACSNSSLIDSRVSYISSQSSMTSGKYALGMNTVQRCIKGFINRADSFPRKILTNSAGQLAKFCSSLRQNRPNSAARHRLPFMTENLRELFRNFSYWRLALYYMPMRNYAVRIGPFSLKLCSNINRKSFSSSHKCNETHD